MNYMRMTPPDDEPTYKEETFRVTIPLTVVDLNNINNESLVFLGDTDIDDFKTLDELKQAINQLITDNR